VVERVNVEGAAKPAAFCHATVWGDKVHVSGTLGTLPGTRQLTPGGVEAQTIRALENIDVILGACDCGLADVAKFNVFLTDMSRLEEMNRGYLRVLGDDPPARITVGCSALALGATVEIDCIAYKPS
jgi:2-iminobutanoate/2-iminopropanoate deaminase